MVTVVTYSQCGGRWPLAWDQVQGELLAPTTLSIDHCTVHYTLHTVHCIIYTIECTLYRFHRPLSTVPHVPTQCLSVSPGWHKHPSHATLVTYLHSREFSMPVARVEYSYEIYEIIS